MTLDPTPPGIHPTDAMLLFLGDLKSDADAAQLEAELHLNAAPGALAADDPFTPALVRDAWSHLGACEQCTLRRRALFVELSPAMTSVASDTAADLTPTLDSWIRAAVTELVPTAAALPQSLVRPAPPRRRWFAGRSGAGIDTASGRGGAVARPWIIGFAAAGLLVAVGAAFALRPRPTEQSAVGTVPPRVGRAAPGDTTSLETSAITETEAAAETEVAAQTEAALTAGAMADAPAASKSATGGAPPATTANPSVGQVAPIPAAREAATGRATRVPAEPSPPPASSKTTTASAEAVDAQAANPVPPQAAKKRAPAPTTASSAASAAGPPAGSEPLATADLGTFADAASALDRFAARASAPTESASSQLGPQPSVGSRNALNTASPATASPAAAVAPPAEQVLCPTVKGSPRLAARIGDRDVLVVRIADTTADVVLDAASCVELARRTNPPTSAPVGG